MSDPTPSTVLDRYAERVTGSIPLLGSLIWYSVPEAVRVNHTTLTGLLTQVGLDAYTPPEVKDKNVFMRVASSHARKRVPTDDPAIYENYMVRNVVDDGTRAVKQIVVERVNASGVKLDLTPAVQVEYDDGQVTLSFLPSALGQHDQAMAVAELIEQDYNAQRNSVNAYGVRELIRKVILQNGATTVRSSGGVYFLAESKQDVIASLVELGNNIPLVDVHPVPLIDDSRQREMLRKAVEAETIDEIDKTLAEIDELGETITVRKYTAIVEKMNDLKAKTKEYTELLDETLDAAQFRMQVYTARVKKLYESVE